jgi:hypothetical protein
MNDTVRAAFLAASNGAPQSPVSMITAARAALAILAGDNASAVAIADNLDENTGKTLMDSAWYKKTLNAVFPAESSPGAGPVPRAPSYMGLINIAGIEFLHFSSGSFVMQSEYPHLVTVPEYYIAAEQQGTGVDWPAAKKACEELSGKLPGAAGPPYIAVLPSEAEWEYAAAGPGKADFKYGLAWDWCSDYFTPVNYLKIKAGDAIPSPQRSVRGGNAIGNASSKVEPETRAGLYPNLKSQFTGWRPVVVRGEE